MLYYLGRAGREHKYVGLMLDWDYEGKQIHLLIPGYVRKAFKKLGHEKPRKRQDQLHEHVPTKYGAKKQFMKENDNLSALVKEE